MVNRAIVALGAGEARAARADLAAAARAGSARAYEGLALLESRRGRWAEAAELFEEALRLITESGGAAEGGEETERSRTLRGRLLLGAGVSFLMERNLESALRRLDEAVVIRKDCSQTLFNRAVARVVARQWDLAEKDLRLCVSRLPLEPQAWLLKSETVVAQQMVGRTREALTDYANALLLQDWHEEQRAARRAGLVLDG